MRLLSAALLAGAFLTIGSALAAPADPLAGLYGNALVRMNQPLYMIRTWYDQNGSFRQFEATHETGTLYVAGWEGKYTVQGSGNTLQVCKTYNPSPAYLAAPEPGCMPLAGNHKVGDVWKVTLAAGAHKGTTDTYIVEAGHNTEP